MDPVNIGFRLIASFLPEELSSLIHSHILDPHGPFQAYKREAQAQLGRLLSILYPVVRPAMEKLLELLSDNQGAAGVAATLALAAAAIIVLNWLRRLMMWWTRLLARVAFWAAVVAVAAVVVQRGPMQTVKEVVVWGSRIAGWAVALQQEMQHHSSKGEERQHRGGRGSSGGY